MQHFSFVQRLDRTDAERRRTDAAARQRKTHDVRAWRRSQNWLPGNVFGIFGLEQDRAAPILRNRFAGSFLRASCVDERYFRPKDLVELKSRAEIRRPFAF
jgi:hypothetical protein